MLKIKLSLFLTKHRAMKTHGRVEIQLHAPADLPPGKKPLVPIGYGAEWAS
jgi:hypothetical protein